MLSVVIALSLTLLSLIGLIFNLVIVIALCLSKRLAVPTNLLILHLGVIHVQFCAAFLLVASPSLLRGSGTFLGFSGICSIQGFITTTNYPIMIWNLSGIHLDRFASIAYPLRYTNFVTRSRIITYMGFAWVNVMVASLPTAFGFPGLEYRTTFGTCVPAYSQNLYFPVLYSSLGLIVPFSIILIVNLRIVRIAKYHQFRIANALLGMSFPPTEQSQVRLKQRESLKKFEGMKGVLAVTQLVGSLTILYAPFVTMIMVESITKREIDPWLGNLCLILVMVSPIYNGIAYGLKNKDVMGVLTNFVRKEYYKNEIQQEIRLRSPGPPSSRASMHNIFGQLSQVPMLKRHISSTSMTPDLGNRKCRSSSTFHIPSDQLACLKRHQVSQNNQKFNASSINVNQDDLQSALVIPKPMQGRPPPLQRHTSDLTWRIKRLQEAEIAKIALEPIERGSSEEDVNDEEGQYSIPVSRQSSGNSLGVPGQPRFDRVSTDDEDAIIIKTEETNHRNAKENKAPRENGSVTFENFNFISKKIYQLAKMDRQSPKPTKVVLKRAKDPPPGTTVNNEDSDASSDFVPLENSDSEGCNNSLGSMNNSRKGSISSCHKKTSGASSTRLVSSTFKSIWHSSHRFNKDRPRITITRVPTIDQSSLEFLYPEISITPIQVTSSVTVHREPKNPWPSKPEISLQNDTIHETSQNEDSGSDKSEGNENDEVEREEEEDLELSEHQVDDFE